MAKVDSLTDIANLQNETSVVAAVNGNNDKVEAAFANTLSRDGSSPNTMESTLDMNSNRIVNLPAPTTPTEPVRVVDLASEDAIELHSQAENVDFDPAGNLASTNVQDALEELDAEKQPLDSDLTAIAALSPSNDDLIQRKAGAWTNRTVIQVVSDISATNTFQPLDSDLTAIAGLSPSNDDIVQRKAGAWTNRSIAQLVSDITATNTYQPLDSDLTAIAALSTTTYGRSLLTLAAASNLRTEALVENQAMPPCGRLTLTSGTPVLASSTLGATTIYFTPYNGNLITWYDTASSTWKRATFSELSLPLDADSGHTGYHQQGKNFDLFFDYNGGSPRLVSGPAWTNDTTRADALTRLNGLVVNNATMTVRFGTASGNTASASANSLLHLGTFRATANGQASVGFGGSNTAGNALLWNRYNRKLHAFQADEPTNGSWAVSAGTTQNYNSNGNLRVNILNGDDDEAVTVMGMGFCTQANTEFGQVLIGLDSSTAAWGGTVFMPSGTGVSFAPGLFTYGMARTGLGFHFVQLLEKAVGGTVDFYGDNGDATSFKAGIMASVWI